MASHGHIILDKQRKYEDDVEEDDNVSILSKSGHFKLSQIVLRLLLGLIFLCAGVGAVVYSVVNSEKEEDVDASKNFFPYDQSEESISGYMATTIITSDDGNEVVYQVTQLPIHWIQDSANKRLYLREGNRTDDGHTFYVFENYSWIMNATNCVYDNTTGYEKFLYNLALKDIPKKPRMERIDLGDRKVSVNAYEGEPEDDIVIQGIHPAIVFAYSDIHSNVGYRWEIFFPRENPIRLYKIEYWFPDMVAKTPDGAIFTDLPRQCSND